MSNHNSATPHTINSTNNGTISEALKQRAQSVINDKSVDVRRADADEAVDNTDVPPTREKIEALVEIICGGGDKSPAALLVLMATLEDAPEPQALAHTAKHFAFTHCGELNVYGMVDSQIALIERKLLPTDSPVS